MNGRGPGKAASVLKPEAEGVTPEFGSEGPTLETLRAAMRPGLGAYWQVTCGLFPGMVDPDCSRRFELTSTERRDAERFKHVQEAAHGYAMTLEGRGINWARVEFVWL